MLNWKVGGVSISCVVEFEPVMPGSGLFPMSTPEALKHHAEWLRPHFVDGEGNLLMSIHAFLLESQGHRILVDTCLGNHRQLPFEGMSDLSGPFLEDIAAAGHPREQIDPQPTPGLTTFGRFDLCEQPDLPYPQGLRGSRLLLEEATENHALDSSDTSEVPGAFGALEGVYDWLGTLPGPVPSSDQREATGVLVVLVDNLDPSREVDFNRWYDEIPVPDILSAGSFDRATRYRATGSDRLAAYLAVYETDWKDPLAAQGAMAGRPNPAGLWDSIAPVHLAVYRRR